MKKAIVLLGLSAMVMVACSKKTTGSTTSTTPAVSQEKAATFFGASCAGCHGADGDSGRAPDLTPMRIGKTELVSVITNGRGHMPGFADTYSKAEIDALADYVISIRK